MSCLACMYMYIHVHPPPTHPPTHTHPHPHTHTHTQVLQPVYAKLAQRALQQAVTMATEKKKTN